jgi:hypothetical protein
MIFNQLSEPLFTYTSIYSVKNWILKKNIWVIGII